MNIKKSNLLCKVCLGNKTIKLFDSFNTHGRHILDSNDKFSILRCKNCGVIFLGNVEINKKYYEKYYETGYYNQTEIKKNSLIDKFLKFVSKISILRNEKLIINSLADKNKKISILDIGCGNGNFLANLNSLKFDKNGVEINKEGYEISKKKGLNVFNGNIKDVNFGKKKFDVISLWHVLEHIDNPNELFKIINKILLNEGVVIFQIPNTDSLGFKFGKKYWFHLDSPRHLILYNEKNIRKLCQLNNFKVISIKNQFYGYPLDLFWSIRKSNIRFLFYPLYPIVKFLSRETLTYICKKV